MSNTLCGIKDAGAAEPRDHDRLFLSELIGRLNEPFGSDLSEKDKVMFAMHISGKPRENGRLTAQVRNNPRDEAMKADLPEAASDSVVDAMRSHRPLASRLLSDSSIMTEFVACCMTF